MGIPKAWRRLAEIFVRHLWSSCKSSLKIVSVFALNLKSFLVSRLSGADQSKNKLRRNSRRPPMQQSWAPLWLTSALLQRKVPNRRRENDKTQHVQIWTQRVDKKVWTGVTLRILALTLSGTQVCCNTQCVRVKLAVWPFLKKIVRTKMEPSILGIGKVGPLWPDVEPGHF